MKLASKLNEKLQKHTQEAKNPEALEDLGFKMVNKKFGLLEYSDKNDNTVFVDEKDGTLYDYAISDKNLEKKVKELF